MENLFMGLMLGSGIMLCMPPTATVAHEIGTAASEIAAAAEAYSWDDLRVSIACSEGDRAAALCRRSRKP